MLPHDYKNILTTCPMCLGKGYCNEDKSTLSFSGTKPTRIYPKRSLRLPAIETEKSNFSRHSSGHGSEFPTIDGSGDIHLPTILHRNSSYIECGKNSINHQNNMIYASGDGAKLPEKKFETVPAKSGKPQDALKLALLQLKQTEWDSTVQALINIAQISRSDPELIDSSMPIVNRSICRLLRNIRSNVARTACQVAAELFKTMQCTQRPEFDELAGMLLQKTADMNKFVREDAYTALEAMADFIPPLHCVRVMASSRGSGHKNPLVRATVSRLLRSIVTTVGVDTLLTTAAVKEMRSRIFAMCAMFLVDGNSETRNNARALIKILMAHANFEPLFNQEVDRKLTDRIKKQLVTLKYDTPNDSHISK